jgi:hypothetical protein
LPRETSLYHLLAAFVWAAVAVEELPELGIAKGEQVGSLGICEVVGGERESVAALLMLDYSVATQDRSGAYVS